MSTQSQGASVAGARHSRFQRAALALFALVTLAIAMPASAGDQVFNHLSIGYEIPSDRNRERLPGVTTTFTVNNSHGNNSGPYLDMGLIGIGSTAPIKAGTRTTFRQLVKYLQRLYAAIREMYSLNGVRSKFKPYFFGRTHRGIVEPVEENHYLECDCLATAPSRPIAADCRCSAWHLRTRRLDRGQHSDPERRRPDLQQAIRDRPFIASTTYKHHSC